MKAYIILVAFFVSNSVLAGESLDKYVNRNFPARVYSDCTPGATKGDFFEKSAVVQEGSKVNIVYFISQPANLMARSFIFSKQLDSDGMMRSVFSVFGSFIAVMISDFVPELFFKNKELEKVVVSLGYKNREGKLSPLVSVELTDDTRFMTGAKTKTRMVNRCKEDPAKFISEVGNNAGGAFRGVSLGLYPESSKDVVEAIMLELKK